MKAPLVKLINIPPVWLFGFCALAWMQSDFLTFGLSIGGAWSDFLGGLLVGVGIF